MYKVYLVHVYSDHLLHINEIINADPDIVILWSDVEYEALNIFDDFLNKIYEHNINKKILILYPGPSQQVNDHVFLEHNYGYYLINKNHIVNTNLNVDFTNIHTKADKLYTLYCNRGSHERVKLIDIFARENLLGQGIVTFKNAYFVDDMELNNLWEYHDGSKLSDEDDFVLNTKENYRPHHFPKSFFNGFIDVVCESRVDDIEYFLTEKTAKSIVALKPFISLSSQYYHKHLQEEYNILPYTELFDYEFDRESDINLRIEGIVENIKKIKSLDKNTLHDKAFDKLVHNKKQLIDYENKFDKMVPESLMFVFDKNYKLMGDTYSMNSWFDTLYKNKWLT